MMVFELPLNAKKSYMHVFEGSKVMELFEKYDSYLTRYILCSIEGVVIGGICYYQTLKIGKKILSGKALEDIPPTNILNHKKMEWVRSEILLGGISCNERGQEVEKRLLSSNFPIRLKQ